MQLVMRRYRLSQIWYHFRINARMTLDGDERMLLTKYILHDVVITEGNVWRDIRRAVIIAFILTAIITTVIYIRNQLEVIYLILLSCIVLASLSYLIYQQIREEVRVNDLLTGRDFKARSFIGLLKKEHDIRKMSDVFAKVVNQARTWHEPEVIELAPQPLANVLEGYDRAVV